MPQKLNKAGNMQNYVPAGNGDASGEYGDNATGSNKHFTNFKKQSRVNELSNKQKKEIANYVYGKGLPTDDNIARTIKNLRYYTGSFGDLSNFTDDELKEIINEFRDLEESDTPVYVKEGQKWKLTRRTGLLDKLGIEYYTKEEYKEKIKNDSLKLVEKSQTPQDKEIQKIVGGNCLVCFGKGYQDEDLDQIVKDTQVLYNEFPELKDQLTMMGDRNNLEKLYNAMQELKEPTEEDIQKMVERLKKTTTYFGISGDDLEKQYRKDAIRELKRPIKIENLRNAYAYWSQSQKAMIYLGAMKKTFAERRQLEYEMNFKSSNKKNATFTHEMGHAIDTILKNKYEDLRNKIKNKYEELRNEIDAMGGTKAPENKIKEIGEVWEKYLELDRTRSQFESQIRELKGENYDKENRRYNLSEYGATNINEFVAESFSAYYTGMNNPLANKVVQAFKDFSNNLRRYE